MEVRNGTNCYNMRKNEKQRGKEEMFFLPEIVYCLETYQSQMAKIKQVSKQRSNWYDSIKKANKTSMNRICSASFPLLQSEYFPFLLLYRIIKWSLRKDVVIGYTSVWL